MEQKPAGPHVSTAGAPDYMQPDGPRDLATGGPIRPTNLAVLSWALYDLANTVFSMNIVSGLFSLWVVNIMGGTDSAYGNAASLSMLLLFISAPVLGALSDRAGGRMPFLIVSTLLCVGFTMLLGLGGLAVSLVFFIIANYMFQAGLIFYDSLLPTVSTEENRGRIGGFGIGVGYLGSFIGVGSGLLLLDRIGYVGMFRLTGLLFLVFAIPCFLFVKERGRGFKFDPTMISGAFAQIRHTIPRAGQFPGLARFLIGRLFYTDPVNTIILFMSIYVTAEVGFSTRQALQVMLVAIVFAVIGGFAWGWVVDRIGPQRSLSAVLILWIVTLSGAVAVATLDLPGALFWVVACLAGSGMGGMWAADRPLMLRLTPPKYLGEFYGLYSMVGRFSAIVGPLLWGLIADTLGWGRPAAVASLLVIMVVAYFFIAGVDDTPREWPAELAA